MVSNTIKSVEPSSFGLVDDFTESRMKEIFLQKTIDEWNNTFDSIPDMIAIFNRDRRIIKVNKAFADTLGIAPEDIKGKHCYEVIHGVDAPIPLCPFTRTLQTGQPNVQVLFVPRLERHLEVRTSPIFNDRGEITGMVHISRDITEQVQIEETLRASEDKFSKAFQSSPDLVMISSLVDSTIVDVNDTFLATTGFSREETIGELGENLKMWISSSDEDRFFSLIRKTSSFKNEEFTFRMKSGEIRVWLCSADCITVSGVPCMIMVAVDITDRKHLEKQLDERLVDLGKAYEKLKKLDELKTDFISVVSHELRTPLTSIKGYIDLILEGDTGEVNEIQNEFLGIVQYETNRLSALVADLLDVGRIESGKLKLKKVPVALDTIIKRAVLSIQPLADERGIRFSLPADETSVKVLVDQERIEQVLINLFTNAIKYNHEHGKVTVTVAADVDFVQVSIKDTGVGIPSEDMPFLFSRFFRAGTAAKTKAGGTGLGLSIAKSIVELHGGNISVKSVEHEGSTFSFTLPRAK